MGVVHLTEVKDPFEPTQVPWHCRKFVTRTNVSPEGLGVYPFQQITTTDSLVKPDFLPSFYVTDSVKTSSRNDSCLVSPTSLKVSENFDHFFSETSSYL